MYDRRRTKRMQAKRPFDLPLPASLARSFPLASFPNNFSSITSPRNTRVLYSPSFGHYFSPLAASKSLCVCDPRRPCLLLPALSLIFEYRLNTIAFSSPFPRSLVYCLRKPIGRLLNQTTWFFLFWMQGAILHVMSCASSGRGSGSPSMAVIVRV